MSIPQHLYWFAPYNLTCPSTRYRGKLPLEYLHKHHSIGYDFFYPQSSWKAYLQLFWLVLKMRFWGPKDAVVVVQKICTQRRYARFLRWLVAKRWHPTWYDLDDAEQYRQPTESLHYFLTYCDYITVGSHALADYARAFNPRVYLNTSPVPLQPTQTRQKGTPFTIGWVGDTGDGNAVSRAFAHRKSLLELLLPALEQLEFPVRLVLIGVKRPNDVQLFQTLVEALPQVELVIPTDLDWQKDDWLYPQIRQFDVGVSPLVDHPFNQAKSAFKAKQYLACGVPVVGSAVGENSAFIHHGSNGFLGETVDALAKGLSGIHALSEREYRDFSEAAQRSARDFSVARYVACWGGLWQGTLPMCWGPKSESISS